MRSSAGTQLSYIGMSNASPLSFSSLSEVSISLPKHRHWQGDWTRGLQSAKQHIEPIDIPLRWYCASSSLTRVYETRKTARSVIRFRMSLKPGNSCGGSNRKGIVIQQQEIVFRDHSHCKTRLNSSSTGNQSLRGAHPHSYFPLLISIRRTTCGLTIHLHVPEHKGIAYHHVSRCRSEIDHPI
ncbi:hypothetical protein M426DRAFT_243680 [Hypoxylon sp. CI-4A]|nr:hypothetical protein M426DRAFT_243680 [Hypoxylon sp. CI-4A]